MHTILVLSVFVALSCAAPQYSFDAGASQGRGGDKYLPPAQAEQAPLISKKFYIISAPEDNNNAKNKHLVLGRPQKNYRIIFIKAPQSDNANVKYSAEFAPQEEKTIVYVLTKKEHELNAEDIATPAPTQPSKPEVHFIKYNTDDEAQQAQKEIQGEYDKLGGTNEVSDEGSAPLHSVVGSLDGLNPDGSYNYRPINSGNANLAQPISPSSAAPVAPIAPNVPATQYLPAIFRV